MKALFTAAVAVICLSGALGAQEAREAEDPEPQFMTGHFGPASGYRVTMQSAMGVVAVLEVPDNVFLSVMGRVDPEYQRGSMPKTFHGNVTIRTRRADEVDFEKSRAADEFMAESPVKISLEGATVVVEPLEGEGA